MRYALALLLPLALGGCNNLIDNQDRAALTQFKVTSPGAFEYTTDAVLRAGESVSTAPVSREDWLRDWLSQNQMCGGGYSITNRSGARSYGALMGDVYKVTYQGRCA